MVAYDAVGLVLIATAAARVRHPRRAVLAAITFGV